MHTPQRLHGSGVFVAVSHGNDPNSTGSADLTLLPGTRLDRHDNGHSAGAARTGREAEDRALRALHVIVGSPGIGVSRLAKDMSIQQPTASQAVKALASRRWVDVVRDQRDRRAVRIYASFDGLVALHRRRSDAGEATDLPPPCRFGSAE